MSGPEIIQLDVEAGDDLSRLDVFLTAQLQFTRSRIQKLIDSGSITIDGKPAKAAQKLRGGESIRIEVDAPEELDMEAQEIPIDIVFEDQYLAVVNKPAGLVTHPGAGVSSGTLVNALLFHFQGRLSGISGVLRPGIVHRLDKDTSGLLVVAKEDKAHQGLAAQIKAKTARRSYIALVEGSVSQDSDVVNKPIGRHPVRRKEMAVVENGRPAVSRYEVLKRWPAYTLMHVHLETGRTHQIRVHMASLGHPVVGDLVYNKKRTGSEAARRKFGLLGHALHASQLSFKHPITGRLLEFEAPLPADFQQLIDSL